MAVAKRQRKEKPMKIEQRKVQGPEGNLRWAPSLHRVSSGWGEKIHKKKSQKLSPSVSLSSLLFFCVSLRSCLRDVFSFVFQIQLSCNTELYHWSIHHFKFLLRWDRTEEITYSPDVSIKNLSIRISSVSKFNIYCYLFHTNLQIFLSSEKIREAIWSLTLEQKSSSW